MVFASPVTGAPLEWHDDHLASAEGERFPIVRGIPRFVSDDLYTGSFSFEWRTFNQTQLDVFQGSDSSEEVLRAKTGLVPEEVRDRLVLDAGTGAGRFAD